MKVYPAVVLMFAGFHVRKGGLAVTFAAVFGGLVALPLLVTPPATLWAQWRSWGQVVSGDTLERGFSVMQLLRHWTGPAWPDWPVQLAGTFVLLLPLALRRDRWPPLQFRPLHLCSGLVDCVLFN